MRPSLTRCVLPCVALCLPACHAGGDEFTGDELTVGGSGSNSAPKTTGDTAGNDTPPFPTTLPPDPEDASGESGGDTTTSSADDSDDDDVSPACPPPDVGVDLVPFNAACDIPLQLGGFEPVVEWKWGDGQFCGPPVAGQTIDTNASGDLDDGDLPLVFLYRGDDVVALWGDGSGVAWQAEGFYGGYSSGLALGDLDGDGWPEIVTINNSAACALDARDGSEKWCSVHLGDSIDGNGTNYPAIADMDGDGQAEVVIGPKILSSTGQVIGTGKPGKGSTPWLGDPNITAGALSAVVDLDGDGVQEVVTGNAAYDLDGNSVWQNGGLDGFVAVADFDLDGAGRDRQDQRRADPRHGVRRRRGLGPDRLRHRRGRQPRPAGDRRPRRRRHPRHRRRRARQAGRHALGRRAAVDRRPSRTSAGPPAPSCSTSRRTASPRS
jgi:hypothetical protein